MTPMQQANLLKRWIEVKPKDLPSKRVMIPKPNTTELRPLSIPRLEMRVNFGILHFILSLTVFTWVSANQFGFIPNRSIAHAWLMILQTIAGFHTKLVKVGNYWYTGFAIYEYDLAKFFDSISKELLMETYLDTLKCTMEAAKYINELNSIDCIEDNVVIPQTQGLPQGAATSPLIANACLEKTGLLKTDNISGMIIQYADDGMLISPKESIDADLNVLRSRLRGGIAFKETKSHMSTSGIIKFLGVALNLYTGDIRLATRSGRTSFIGMPGIFLYWLHYWYIEKSNVILSFTIFLYVRKFSHILIDEEKAQRTRLENLMEKHSDIIAEIPDAKDYIHIYKGTTVNNLLEYLDSKPNIYKDNDR